ncbi:beta-ketoacyl-ACP synthase II [Nonomuraea sp. NN258]|uniref:beta-ketoacyl-[acyl-carrier-protein] synthase family protein n=1 Tax=Nonomuraea antri TaxID=2730852 RepID=UPI0015698385|nr:beta-ketoacyl-ACP synthase II [Nonomuraea antri]NRQ31653.1 beta-ketoacyl-ACP synthase II [Nonomuraea antri]
MRRIVVTGIGVVSPLGLDWQKTWAGLVGGVSGIQRLADIDVSGLPVTIGGQVTGFNPLEYLPAAVAKRAQPHIQLALTAATAALNDAKLSIDPQRSGVVVGTVCGTSGPTTEAADALGRRGFLGLGPYTFTATGVVTAAAEIALLTGAQGPSAAIATACATGASCVGEGMRLIQRGDADVVLAGGCDSISRLELAAAARAKALSRRNDEPERASRPFDRARDGFVMAEGAGVLVLEEAGHAQRRGARIYGELAGYGATTDAYHLTAPDPGGSGVARAMRAALAEAGVTPDSVGYVNAHGTGTPRNDSAEIAVIRHVFGAGAETVPVSSTKSMTGHMLGAAGAVEAAVALQTVLTGIVPPTVNCDDPEDTGLNLVRHTAQEHRVDVAISNSFGFGGHNAVLVVRRWPD